MSGVRTVFANMSWLMVSQIITSVCAFVWTILTARYLGAYDYGILGNAVSFSVIFGVLADFGVTTYIVRSIATDLENEDKYLSNAITLKFFLSIVYFIAVILALIIQQNNSYVILICLIFALENLIKSFHGVMFSSFQAHEQMKYQAITNTILNVLTLVFIFIVTFTDWSLIGISLAYVFANLIALVYEVYALVKNIIVPKLTFDFGFYKKLLWAGIPFALTGLFYTIYYSIDMVMISSFAGFEANGLYNATYKLISVLTLFYSIYTSVVFPVMSKLFRGEKDLLQLSFNKSIKYLSLVTIPLSVATLFYAGDAIYICYGNQYSGAEDVLKILIWTVSFLFINGAGSMILNASHKEVSVTKIYCIAAIFNVILNLILIPRYSVYGASIATVISEILILVLELYMISKINQLPDRHLVFDMIKISLASILLGIFLYCAHLSLWVAIPVSIVVYLVLIVLLKTVDDDDKLIVKQIIGR